MFRPTHFVILFAVILCATAFPGPPADPDPAGPGSRAPQTGGLPPKQPIRGPAGEAGAAKGDLETDATSYWGYRYVYNTPTWDYYNPGYDTRSYNWRSWNNWY